MRRLLVAVSVLVAAVVAVPPAGACACGIALDAEVTRERALVIERPGREEIVASFDLDATGRAAVVLPVPGDPEVAAVEGTDPLAYLDEATRPEPPATDGDGATAGAAPGSGVDVLGRDEIGGYDVTRLAAGDEGALGDWLDANGYALPPGAEPILADYVAEGWRYVAIRLADDADGTLRPLRVAFDTDRPVYPMRLTQLGTNPVDLTLYVLGDGPRRVDGLTVGYEGAVDMLEPAPPDEVAALFGGARQLTKLTAAGADPGTFTEDLAIRAAPAAARAPDDEATVWAWLALGLVVVGVLGGGAALAHRRTSTS